MEVYVVCEEASTGRRKKVDLFTGGGEVDLQSLDKLLDNWDIDPTGEK